MSSVSTSTTSRWMRMPCRSTMKVSSPASNWPARSLYAGRSFRDWNPSTMRSTKSIGSGIPRSYPALHPPVIGSATAALRAKGYSATKEATRREPLESRRNACVEVFTTYLQSRQDLRGGLSAGGLYENTQPGGFTLCRNGGGPGAFGSPRGLRRGAGQRGPPCDRTDDADVDHRRREGCPRLHLPDQPLGAHRREADHSPGLHHLHPLVWIPSRWRRAALPEPRPRGLLGEPDRHRPGRHELCGP